MTGAAVTDGLSAAILVPADPAALVLVRLFATAIGRQADLEEEDVEDLKLALTEVCSAAIEAATGDHDEVTVEVGWSADPVELDVHVVSSSRFSTGDPGSSDRAGLLDALGVSSGERTTVAGWRSLPPWGRHRKEVSEVARQRDWVPQGMRVIDLRLAARPESVPMRVARWTIWPGSRPASLEDARLLVSELVTNSIRHGHLSTAQDIWLQADLEGDTLHVEVRDPGGGFELQPRIAGKDDHDSGWGLYLVGLLAERWGVNADGSTLVWFDMPLRRGTDALLPPERSVHVWVPARPGSSTPSNPTRSGGTWRWRSDMIRDFRSAASRREADAVLLGHTRTIERAATRAAAPCSRSTTDPSGAGCTNRRRSSW